ncbi:endonuclease/exonuclease/phosphatase family protein [Streptomyces sp. NPDC055254]
MNPRSLASGRWSRIAVVCAFCLALVLVLITVFLFLRPAGGAKGAPHQSGIEIRVMHYNVCGAASGCPWNAGGSGRGTSIERVVEQAKETSPDVISLNEVCQDQYQALRGKLALTGLPMDGAFAEAHDNVDNCGRSGSFGSAVLVRQSLGVAVPEHRPYTDTGGETYDGRGRAEEVHRGLLCVTTLFAGRPLKACTTHANATAPGQLEELRRWMDDESVLPEAIPTLIAGDLNHQPNTAAVAPLYESRFVEADEANRTWFTKGSTGGVVCKKADAQRCRNGAPTTQGRKIDYVFADEAHFSLGEPAQVHAFPESDHAMIETKFHVRPSQE